MGQCLLEGAHTNPHTTTRTAPTQENVHKGGEKLILATDAVIKMERTVQLLLIPPQKQIAEL